MNEFHYKWGLLFNFIEVKNGRSSDVETPPTAMLKLLERDEQMNKQNYVGNEIFLIKVGNSIKQKVKFVVELSSQSSIGSQSNYAWLKQTVCNSP